MALVVKNETTAVPVYVPPSVIRSIQRGTIVVTGTAAPNISQVVVAKSFLNISVRTGHANQPGTADFGVQSLGAGGSIQAGGTSLLIQAGISTLATNNQPTVYWEVIEYV